MSRYRVIAVDFDGTIVTDEWPSIGKLNPKAQKVLQRFNATGGSIVLWTCRNGKHLEDAINFLMENEVPFHEVNATPAYRIAEYGCDPRKVGFDLVIDDRDPLSQYLGYVDWDIVEMVLFND